MTPTKAVEGGELLRGSVCCFGDCIAEEKCAGTRRLAAPTSQLWLPRVGIMLAARIKYHNKAVL
jgi:hypothetical protein